jgi:hypothetical protein
LARLTQSTVSSTMTISSRKRYFKDMALCMQARLVDTGLRNSHPALPNSRLPDKEGTTLERIYSGLISEYSSA